MLPVYADHLASGLNTSRGILQAENFFSAICRVMAAMNSSAVELEKFLLFLPWGISESTLPGAIEVSLE